MNDPSADLPVAVPEAIPAAPVDESHRLKLVDALRGVALLGILLMNIPGFAMPNYFSESFRNDTGSANFWVNAVISVVFEGKMRALFGMIFGAGVLLFVTKKEKTGKSVTGLFYRRMAWLIVFGLIHAHLILWFGDILYLYGVCGMLVYLFRNANPKYLVLAVPIVAAVEFTGNMLLYQHIRGMRIDYVEAVGAESESKTLTDAQKAAKDAWRDLEKSLIPNREDAKENTRKMKSDYATVASYVRPLAFKFETMFLPLAIWDSLALMLLGVALYKWGFVSGRWSNRNYWKTLIIGYGLGLPLAIFSLLYRFGEDPSIEAALARMEREPFQWVGILYPFQRILLVMAHVAAIVLLYKAGFWKPLFSRLEAVGQMAFTNYIMHSVICTLVFFGYGLNQFAEWEFYHLFYLVAAIWALQLIVSPIWLKYFLFGPLEWLWRSLTYWKWQPFRRRNPPVIASPPGPS